MTDLCEQGGMYYQDKVLPGINRSNVAKNKKIKFKNLYSSYQNPSQNF